jgi:hypothetical protein
MKNRLANQRGVSLIEAVASVMIISFAIIGLVSSFIYGHFNVERSGVQRKALEVLQGRMELWKNERLRASETQPLPSPPGGIANQDVLLDRDKELHGTLRSQISEVRGDGSLRYQEVSVTLVYDNGSMKDSLGLETKMYLQ